LRAAIRLTIKMMEQHRFMTGALPNKVDRSGGT
jgi:hypothetical protein